MQYTDNAVARQPKTIVAAGWVEKIQPQQSGVINITIRQNNQKKVWRVQDAANEWIKLPLQSVVYLHSDTPSDDPLCRLELVHTAQPLPIEIDQYDYQDLTQRHLGIRSDFFRATAEFRHLVRKYAFEFLDSQRCMFVQTPILTNASCVCSGDVFTFPYYGKQVATLTQSPWMYADALVSGVERVYALNPSFRRENDPTGIHLVEIWQLQVDLAWASNDDIVKMEQDLIHHIAGKLQAHPEVYAQANLSMAHLEQLLKPFKRLTYDDSVKLLNELGYEFEYGSDYTAEHNNAIGAHYQVPYFITDFPMSLKNFWFTPDADNAKLSPSNDLFSHMGQGEIIGGGTRVSDYEKLKENLEFFGHDLDEFAWFVDIRRFGCVPHSGFSIGFDRLVATLMGVQDIRQATLFPRMPQGMLKP